LVTVPVRFLWERPVAFHQEHWGPAGELRTDPGGEVGRLWSMVTNLEIRDLASLVKVAVVTVFLLRCNRLTSYLGPGGPHGAGLTEEEQWLGAVLAHFFMVQDLNSHPLFGLDRGKQLNQVGLENLGSGIFPVVGRHFNHSCTPNTVRVNCGKTMFLLSSSTIQPGEEVCDIYSIHYRCRCSGVLCSAAAL
jgi:hypothetical protein